MPSYRVMCIARPLGHEATKVARVLKEVSSDVIRNGGVVRRVEHHGTRPLAFGVKQRVDVEGQRFVQGRFFSLEMDGQPALMLRTRDMLHDSDLFLRVMTLKHKAPEAKDWRTVQRVFREERKQHQDEFDRVINTEKNRLKKLFQEVL